MKFQVQLKQIQRQYHIYLGDDYNIFLKEEGSKADPLNYIDAVGAIKYRSKEPDKIKAYDELLYQADEIVDEGDGNFLERLYFLKTTIQILVETQRHFVEKPEHFQDLVMRYWLMLKEVKPDEVSITGEFLEILKINSGSFKTTFPLEVAVDIYERFLDLCINDSENDWFERKTTKRDSGNGLNGLEGREVELRYLTDKLTDLYRKLKQHSYSDSADQLLKRIDQCLEHARRWFISRYNIRQARRIYYEQQMPKSKFFWKPFSNLVSKIGPEFFVFVIIGVYFFSDYLTRKEIQISVGAFYGIFFVLPAMVFVVKMIGRDRWYPDIQVHLPRLAAGIIVGYLLLLNDEAWGGIFTRSTIFSALNEEIDLWLFTGKVFVPLGAVFIYILIEINNVRGICGNLCCRAVVITVRGLAYALALGILVSDLFGEAIVTRLSESFEKNQVPLPDGLQGVFGQIYPEAVVYLAPLALFIGVFVQLLWQDRALTEKI